VLQYGGIMKKIVSGITPSGDGSLHIGNYLGAVKQFIDIARENECFLFIADLHALTTIQNKGTLIRNTETLILNELALLRGFGSMDNITFYRQSDIPVHTELQTILSNVTPLGLLKRAHAYKDKLAKDVMEDEINLGLFNYPILMASDILLYKPDLVPVGKDQKQHVEITRDIAEKFNATFKKQIFPLPDASIQDDVAVILGTDGTRKMSKSLGNIISIFDSEDVIKKQVNSCFTDPTRAHANDPGHIEGNMVFVYLDHFGEKSKTEELKKLYTEGNVSDMEVKEYLFQSLISYFGPAREQYELLKADPKLVKSILEEGAQKARSVAYQTMAEVREVIGLTNKYSFFSYPKSSNGDTITIDEFAKVQLRVGKVIEATHPEKSEKLIRLVVDFGDEKRIIFTGVRTYGYTKDDFIGKQFFFVYNLLPRKMIGEESQGMILAVGDDKPLFVSADGLPVGATIR
jgi:tryptophanyl-tRNA synthetase